MANINIMRFKSLIAVLALIGMQFQTSSAFVSTPAVSSNIPGACLEHNFHKKYPPSSSWRDIPRPTSALYMSGDDVDSQLAKAKELLAKAKAKIAADAAEKENTETAKMSEDNNEMSPPRADLNSKKEQVVKSQNPDSGLFTTDGEMMAELSEDEEWEMRSLLDVFEQEFSNDDAERRAADKKERDIALAMFNLRKEMVNDDYKRIFDEKNWKIGEI